MIYGNESLRLVPFTILQRRNIVPFFWNKKTKSRRNLVGWILLEKNFFHREDIEGLWVITTLDHFPQMHLRIILEKNCCDSKILFSSKAKFRNSLKN